MTPDHKFTLWTTILTGLPTIVFTGGVAYWTWRRDQERIVVQKSPQYWNTLDGRMTPEVLVTVGVVVRNLSLFPVRVSGLAFLMDGKEVLVFDRSDHEDEWLKELPSRARMVVYANDREWQQLNRLGLRGKIMKWEFVAVAVTETQSRFVSNRLTVRVFRTLRRLRKWFTRSKKVPVIE
ncbi:MAG TPA: hypothetical protein VHX37_11315 [Acidobacteriaceae bacterium]|jgi:hypothetical protein|nr:hypothetical protein [Acidobacteriaceae bacterium]